MGSGQSSRKFAQRFVALTLVGLAAGLLLTGRAAAFESASGVPAAAASLPAHVGQVLRALRDSGDARGLPHVLVDKAGARVHVFAADGQLLGSAPALLGLARGDGADPRAAERLRQGHLPAAMRTTPAGRFVSQPGRNLSGEAVVWFDYAAALAIHRLRPAPAAEQRPQRLASAVPADHRITLGCVVVAPAFFDQVVTPALGRGKGVVYVLPDRAEDVDAWLAATLAPESLAQAY